MESDTRAATTEFSLRGRSRAITLDGEGLHHPSGSRGGGLVYSAYRDITHLATSSRAVWIGTRRSVYMIARTKFVDPNGPEHLVRALLEEIARQPGGSQQLARMAEIEEVSRVSGPLFATWGLAGACAAVYVAQLLAGQRVEAVGYFTAAFTADGDWWRVVTGNLLHANLAHLVLNLLGLLGVGAIVERAFGSAATACVMACAALGAMAASAWWSPLPVVGVSGVVFGLLAALTWLELRFADRLPAWWRVPRRGLLGTLALSAVLSFLPFISWTAHAGGFVGGGLAAAVLAWRALAPRPSGVAARAVAVASVAIGALAIAAAGHELLRDGDFWARYVMRLESLPGTTSEELNNAAWEIAVDEKSSDELLHVALSLAERAADETEHTKAHILDTLAEVHFQLGDRDAAVTAIDEAIARAPDEDYYREQRRRFLGERDPEDRPVLPPQPAEQPPPKGQVSGIDRARA